MSVNKDSEEVRKGIRTLTSLLHRFNVQKPPSKHCKDISPLLRHFTTLLTCGENLKDGQAKEVIAVTGSINAPHQVRILVVAQNQLLASSVKTPLSVKLIEKDNKRPLEEVVKGAPSVPLASHIADVWAALSAFNPHAADRDSQTKSLELFFLSRSYRMFLARFKEGKKLCGDRWLHEVIDNDDWFPNGPEIPCKWVTVPDWLLAAKGLPSIKSRTVGEKVQWEFSDDTKQTWAKVLRIILKRMHDVIKSANMESEPEKKAKAMSNLNNLCVALYYFVSWNEGIVKSLLTKTNIVAGVTTKNGSKATEKSDGELLQESACVHPTTQSDKTDDEIDELLQEPGETKGQQVYRYLKTLVAWHAAVHRLTEDTAIPELLRNLEIRLVEVSPSLSTVLTLHQVSDTLVTRFPDMKKYSNDLLATLTTRYSSTFTGCVHAEATLMGLVNHHGAESPTSTGQSTVMENAQQIRNIIQFVAEAGNIVIAASKKCCWCCDWLGRNLDAQFRLPGTHGVMLPWDPPVVGVDMAVLERLEAMLWGELHHVVSSKIQALLYSRNDSAGSPDEGRSTKAMRFIPLLVDGTQGQDKEQSQE